MLCVRSVSADEPLFSPKVPFTLVRHTGWTPPLVSAYDMREGVLYSKVVPLVTAGTSLAVDGVPSELWAIVRAARGYV